MYYSDVRYDATEYARSLTIACIAQSFLPPEIANLIIQSLPNAAWEQERITLIKSKCIDKRFISFISAFIQKGKW